MPLRCRASSMFLLLCVSLSLCLESVSGGTSFLSPTQKPQGRRPPRVGRREAADPEIPVIKEDDRFMMSMSLSEAEYEKYGPVLQNLLSAPFELENLLRDSPFEF
nr:proghrelin [Danio rerio]